MKTAALVLVFLVAGATAVDPGQLLASLLNPVCTILSTVGSLLGGSPASKVTDALNCITKDSKVDLLPILQKCVGSDVTDVTQVFKLACNPLGLAPKVLSCLTSSPDISGLTSVDPTALLSCVKNLTPLGK